MDNLFQISEMRHCCRATVVGNASMSIHAVAIDSREVHSGMLFFALPGSHQDGHNFVPQVLQRQAAAIVSHRYYRRLRQKLNALVSATQSALMVVADTFRALRAMAHHYLWQFNNLTRIAITGSNGKTTTKELLAAILTAHAPSYFTPGNRNSAIGLSLAAFELRKRHRFALFEAGTDRRGEIGQIAQMLAPHYALITNIGSAHIGIFGSQRAIAREKRDIAARSAALQALFVAEDEPYRPLLSRGIAVPVITFGPRNTAGFHSFHTDLSGSTLQLYERRITSAISGAFQVNNILAAVAAARHLGCSEEEIARGIASYQPPFGRAQYLAGSVAILQDCYNANPESMYESLHSLAAMNWKGRVVCLLGAMKELGKESAQYHLEVARRALSLFNTHLFLYGEEFQQILARMLPEEQKRIYCYTTIEELCTNAENYLQSGDLLLLKGSRVMQLERVTEYIQGRA